MELFRILVLFIPFMGCDRIKSIPYDPPLKSTEWCEYQPCVQIGDIILSQPTSSILVFILALLTIYSGYYFLKFSEYQHSKKWWGYSLILTGVGAILAGISYQLFGFELKCSEQEYCNWTNWFEIYYNLTTVAGASCLLIAVGYSCFNSKWINLIKLIALIKFSTYSILCLLGAVLPNKLIISYEFLVMFSTPVYIIFLIINIYQYILTKEELYKYYSLTWSSLFIILSFYFIYLDFNITELLWDNKIWFSANDVLHVFMIFWILFIWLILCERVKDNHLLSYNK